MSGKRGRVREREREKRREARKRERERERERREERESKGEKEKSPFRNPEIPQSEEHCGNTTEPSQNGLGLACKKVRKKGKRKTL